MTPGKYTPRKTPLLTLEVNQYIDYTSTCPEEYMKNDRIVLKALTAEMDLAFHGPTLEILEFPFKIGRECRTRNARLPPSILQERRKGIAPRNNDLYIAESSTRLFVSREHLLLELRNSEIYLVDLFSSCGTIVEGTYVGGDHKGGEIILQNNDVVIIGTANSPYIYKVLLD
jgi:hypothetical protein